MVRKLAAELLGTGLLVFFGVGVATLMFGFHFDGGSVAAEIRARLPGHARRHERHATPLRGPCRPPVAAARCPNSTSAGCQPG